MNLLPVIDTPKEGIEAERTALEEWKAHWPLVLAALVGISFPSVASYSISFFIDPLGRDFGWTRTQISIGLSVYAFIVVPLSPVAGAVLDRWGSRKMALIAMLLSAIAFAALGLTSGSMTMWIAQWAFYSLFALGLKTTVWTAAVSNAFHQARGMAIAVTLCGTAVSATFTPLLCNWLIDAFGWRIAYLGLGLGWGGFALVLIFFLFFEEGRLPGKVKGSKESPVPARAGYTGLSFREAIKNRDILRIAAAMMITSMLGVALVVHKVPLLAEMNISRGVAAQIAATAGVASIAGKLVTGWFYDRYHSRWIGAFAFSLPAIGYPLLLTPFRSLELIVMAMIILGLCSGATMQANVYLTSRYGGMRNFGKIFGVMGSVVALATGLGPILGGLIYDYFGSYSTFLAIGIVSGVLCGFLMIGLRPYPVWNRIAEG